MNRQYKVILIDDEKSARRNLRQLLGSHQDQLSIIGEADSVESGRDLIRMVQPDLVFLDVEMPPFTGFDLLSLFPSAEFSIIFTTAYSKYAIQAIRASAIDYLLKPINAEDLTESLQRVKEVRDQHALTQLLQENLERPPENHKIAISSMDAWVFIDKTEIMYLEAARRYTVVSTTKGEHVVSKPLSYFESLLTEPHFFRSHRSYLVNLKFVEKLVKRDGGYILLKNDMQIKLSPSLKEDFILRCQQFG
ncbi:MAG: LytTR family DNA-binding domain-containing protein [Bacteroidota bacterium]